MRKLLNRFFPRLSPKRLDAEEKLIAEKGSERERRQLAKDGHTSQEVLYYLAEKDPSDKVRNIVAANISTPLQASPILARDHSPDVRLTLARRLVRILPELSQDKYSQLYAHAVQSLGILALDEVLKVRKALSETLKDHAYAPPAIANQLARDLERAVAEPVLRFCAALSDDDLIGILETHPANWAAEAVAGRASVSGRVSKAVIDTGNPRAGKILLSNVQADISSELLETIVDRAPEYPEWHKPLAAHRSLSPTMALKLAAHIDNTIKQILLDRSDLDAVTIGEITAIVKRRAGFEASRKKSANSGNAVSRARALHADNALTEEAVSDAIAMHDKDFVMAALALKANVNESDIAKVFDVRAPKSICALCWKAGFSARLALKLQQTYGRVPPSMLIYPRNGNDYALAEDAMQVQLNLIGMA